MQNVHIGAGLTYFGERAFRNCLLLTTLTFSEGLQEIGERAFQGCSMTFQELILPDSVRKIGNYAFYGCEALASVDFGSGLKEIGTHAFAGCIALNHLYIPDSVETIGTQAFRGCTALSDAVLGNGLTSVGNHAFYGCTKLTIYSSMTQSSEGWARFWNSSFRPVVWGCTLSDEGYVLSYTKTTIEEQDERKPLSAPSRDGYVFVGWTTVSGGTAAEYSAEELVNVPDGTTVYAIWEIAPETPDVPETTPDSGTQA